MTRGVSDAWDVEALMAHPFAVAHQAIGMTMEYLDCSGAEALAAIGGRAIENRQTLWGVTADLVERRFQFVTR
jgi:hypothetical protein